MIERILMKTGIRQCTVNLCFCTTRWLPTADTCSTLLHTAPEAGGSRSLCAHGQVLASSSPRRQISTSCLILIYERQRSVRFLPQDSHSNHQAVSSQPGYYPMECKAFKISPLRGITIQSIPTICLTTHSLFPTLMKK